MAGKQGRGESMTSPRRLKAAGRQRQALQLRAKGRSFDEIAQLVGYAGRSGAYKAVMSALQKMLQEPADELRRLELERLDIAMAAIAPMVEDGDLAAIDRWLRISESRRRLLGLDGPAKLDVTSGGESLKTETQDYSEVPDEQLRKIMAQRSGSPAGSPDAGQKTPD